MPRLALLVPITALWFSACGTRAPAPAEQPPIAQPPTPPAPLQANVVDGAECLAAEDCHYDDPCMPTACQAEATPDLECAESQPPIGRCACVGGQCVMHDEEAPAEEAPAEAPPACTSDDTCFFDDACVPTACSPVAPTEIVCEESGPPPGQCHCIAGACVLRRSAPAPEHSPCSADNRCGFRIADGTCAPGQINESVSAPPGAPYPVCRCGGGPGPGLRCNLGWVDPVSCTSANDCWVESGPLGPVPVRRPRRFRGRDFRPCADGEIAPACESGYCVVDPRFAFGC
ncbi:MAG: hypothetical protein AB8I08_35165 [Sandaracinaceae bacterium]